MSRTEQYMVKEGKTASQFGFQFQIAQAGNFYIDDIKVLRAQNKNLAAGKGIPAEISGLTSTTISELPSYTVEPTWFEDSKMGLFVHYVPSVSVRATGGTIDDINAVANAFDAQQLADDAEAFGMEYVVFTAFHYRMRPLYPSAVTEQYRPGNSSDRDVIQDLINALKPKGIKLILYVHASDGYDFLTDQERIDTGWYGPNYQDGQLVDGTNAKDGGYTAECAVTVTKGEEPQEPDQGNYEIIAGNNQTWANGSNMGIEITSNGECAEFNYITVDGAIVSAANYSVREGSAIAVAVLRRR